MLEAIFQDGILSLTLAGLTQWDYGQKLTIKGLTVSSELEVHFSNNIEKEAVVMKATQEESDIITEIPNVLLEKSHDILAWVYTDDGHSGETIRTIIIKVTPRKKPADYISENNAGKVIDYVAMAEEYANSAQESAKSAQDNAEQVQANTDIVKEILANVPDFDSYKKLAEHNKLLYDGLYVKGETYSGIASNKGIKLHKVVGKTEQETTNGYQLLDALRIPSKTQSGITMTNNKDGSITVSGSGQATSAYGNTFYFGYVPNLRAGKLKLKLNGDITFPRIEIIGTTVKEDASVGNRVFNLGGSKEENEIDITQEMINQLEDICCIFYASAGSNIIAGTIKPMLYQDGDGTWEPFTGGKPAPNADYPMDIQNVEINNVHSGTNQLFDASKLDTTESVDGITITNNNDGSFVLNGTSKNVILFTTILDKIVEKGEKYTISANNDSTHGGVLIRLGKEYVDVPSQLSMSSKNATLTFTTTIESNEFVIRVASGVTLSNFKIKPMFNKGELKSWENYNYAKIQTSLTLADGEVYEECQPIVRKKKKIIFDGSSDEQIGINAIGTTNRFTFNVGGTNASVSTPNGICNRLKFEANYTKDTEHFYVQNFQIFTFINASRANSVEEFRTWLKSNPLEIEYELATPTTEELKVPTIPSYYPNTNIWTDNALSTDIEWELLANSDNSLMNEEILKRIEALEAKALER